MNTGAKKAISKTLYGGFVTGYLTVLYKDGKDPDQIESSDMNEVRALVRAHDKKKLYPSMLFYTLIKGRDGVEMKEGLFHTIPVGTQMIKKQCLFLKQNLLH